MVQQNEKDSILIPRIIFPIIFSLTLALLFCCVIDLVGFITALWKNTSKNNREYFDIKLKIDVDQYSTVRMMKLQNPGITDEHLRSLQTGAIRIKISKMYATSTGSIFFNSSRGSSIDENVPVNFKINYNMKLTIKQIKCRSSGTFTVSGSIKCITDIQQRENKKLREAIIYDGTDHIKITLWEDQLDKPFKKKAQWYVVTDVNVRN